MADKKKQVMAPEFDANGNQTLASMMYGRIDSDYLTRLIMEHKANMEVYKAEVKKLPPDRRGEVQLPVVSDRLAEAILIIIRKTAGIPRWRKYSEDWKEEMFARAEYLILRYVHNFDPGKLAKNSKNNDPYYYIGMICTRAFQQVWNKMDKVRQKITFCPLNEGIYHSCVSLDHYAGVITEEEARRKAKKSADLANEGRGMDETIEAIEALEQE